MKGELDSDLIAAAEAGDVDAGRAALSSGADPNASDEAGRAVLHAACRSGALALVQLLIEQHGVAVDIPHEELGAQPLHYAVSGHELEVAAYLLDQGAAVDARDGDGRTALHYAAVDGWTEVVRFLHQRGATMSLQSEVGETALHEAADGGRVEAVRLLLELGADPACVDIRGRTARDLATDDLTRLALTEAEQDAH